MNRLDLQVILYTKLAEVDIDEGSSECFICCTNFNENNIQTGLGCLDTFCTDYLKLYAHTNKYYYLYKHMIMSTNSYI